MSATQKFDQSAWLKATPTTCANESKGSSRPWRFVLLGAPGIGKGTQAELLTAKLGACQLSTGDVFRAAKSLPVEEQSPAIREAIAFMTAGKLVPDATVIELVRERAHCLHWQHGFLLDGFPRTEAQAEALGKILKDEGLELDAVISYELPVEKVVERIAGRRVCSKCKKSYHVVDFPPKNEGVCDACGGSLFQRADDQPDAVRVRLAVYEKSTAPLINYYEKRGKLVRIECDDSPKGTFERTLKALKIS